MQKVLFISINNFLNLDTVKTKMTVHLVIEQAAKRVEIFVLEQWYMLIKTASEKQKYNVVILHISKIFDKESVYQKTVAHKGWCKISKMQVINHEAENVCCSYSALEETCTLEFKKMKELKQ